MNEFGRKTSKEGKHHIYNLIILDESGSMSSIRKETLEGLASVFTSIRDGLEKFPEQQHSVSLISFSSRDLAGNNFTKLLWNQPVDNIPSDFGHLYKPNGGTPLNDAIGLGILELKKELKNLSPDGYNVLVTILTDGEENSSEKYSFPEIRQMIEACSEGAWTFAFIGAGLEAYDVAENLSIRNATIFEPSSSGLKALFQKTRRASLNYMEIISNPEKRSSPILNFFSDDKEDNSQEKI